MEAAEPLRDDQVPDDSNGRIGRYHDLKLLSPIYSGGRYGNPWSSWKDQTFQNMIRYMWIFATKLARLSGLPLDRNELDKTLPVTRPNFATNTAVPKVTWLGHASVVVQMDGVTVLTDPIFSDRCSPFQWIGTKRYRPVACTVAELPAIDAVVISHNHYDHLDLPSVKALNSRFGKSLRWYVPAGTASWMRARGCENVVEMSWWEENKLPGTEIVFAFTPSQHWCKRGLFDYCRELWGSWCIIGPKHRFFFPGDTGYCDSFKEIGKVYGPFDGAAIPIGAYEPRWCMEHAHVMPEESVKIHSDVGSRQSVGVHWGTFILTTEHYLDPPIRLKASLKDAGIPEQQFRVLGHGESLSF